MEHIELSDYLLGEPDILLIATFDPLIQKKKNDLKLITGYEIELVQADKADLIEFIQMYYGDFDSV